MCYQCSYCHGFDNAYYTHTTSEILKKEKKTPRKQGCKR